MSASYVSVYNIAFNPCLGEDGVTRFNTKRRRRDGWTCSHASSWLIGTVYGKRTLGAPFGLRMYLGDGNNVNMVEYNFICDKYWYWWGRTFSGELKYSNVSTTFSPTVNMAAPVSFLKTHLFSSKFIRSFSVLTRTTFISIINKLINAVEFPI